MEKDIKENPLIKIMVFYKTYAELTESVLLDRGVVMVGKKCVFAILFFSLLSGPISSLLPITTVLLRPYILDISMRRMLAWSTVVWCLFTGCTTWSSILMAIELVRETIRYGVPLFFKHMSKRLRRDERGETFIKRGYRLLRELRAPNPTILSHLYMIFNSTYEPFTDEEWAKVLQLFERFEETCFVIDNEQYSITVFFPSFILRIFRHGIQATKSDSIKLIKEEIFEEDDKCTICLNNFSQLSVELKCGHRYCFHCIFAWINQNYTCPCCRKVIE